MSDTETSGTEYSASAKALAKSKAKELALKKKRQETLAANKRKAKSVGRPKGSKNKLTLLREAVVEKSETLVLNEWQEVVTTTLELAKQGDTTCLKILWDRVIPSKRAIDPNDHGDKKPVVQINISGLSVQQNVDADLPATHDDIIVEAEYEEVEENVD
jgi:hypothetical protein